jgi:uncharacterized protein (TIGR02271 family)
MTMHADQLVGAPVIDSDGQAVGTVEQVFRDDVDGTPSWARIRSGTGLHFVPLAGSSMTGGGDLSLPFNSQKIMKEPEVLVDRHMSVEQEEQLRTYFGMTVPPQPGPESSPESGTGQTQPGKNQQARMDAGSGQPSKDHPSKDQAATTKPDGLAKPEQQAGSKNGPGGDASQDWLVRSEERLAVNLETRESGRVKLHKRIETEPVNQKVQVSHEEYEIERVPVSKEDNIRGNIAEGDQEIILHETRAVMSKETVPVERVRLSVKRVEEEKTVTDQLRKEKIEIDSGPGAGKPPKPGA